MGGSLGLAQKSPTIYDYLQRAFQRPPARLPPKAAWRGDAQGNLVAFRARIENGRIVALEYRSTTCATLLALCEHLVELIPGRTAAEALAYSARDLLALHPEIPAGHRARARLAVRALRAALSLVA
jgi:NifU-like protein involved in Fe-S cluster formation